MFNKNFSFELRSNVVSGPNTIKKVYRFLKEKNFKKVGLVLDKNLYEDSKYIKKFSREFKKKVSKVVLFFDGLNEPTYQLLDATIRKLKLVEKVKFDCLIAIGGGSTIDFGKGIATMMNNNGKSLSFRGFPKNLKPSVPIIAIPSTTGTGSELAYNAVFTDLNSKTKLGINTKNNYPILSILDPKIIISSPKSVILNSSLGALVRSIDSMFNKKSNDISNIFSKNSFKLLFNNLPKVLKKKKNIENLSKMQWGAYLSIAALLNSSSGPAGAASYYLSTNFGIPQGLGYAISGIYFFKKNHSKGFYNYSKLYDLIESAPNKKKISKKEKSKFVIQSLLKILKDNKVSLVRKNILGTEEDQFINFMYNKTIKIKSNNPISLNRNDLKAIVREILKA